MSKNISSWDTSSHNDACESIARGFATRSLWLARTASFVARHGVTILLADGLFLTWLLVHVRHLQWAWITFVANLIRLVAEVRERSARGAAKGLLLGVGPVDGVYMGT